MNEESLFFSQLIKNSDLGGSLLGCKFKYYFNSDSKKNLFYFLNNSMGFTLIEKP